MSSEKTMDQQSRAIAATWRTARRLGERLATVNNWLLRQPDEALLPSHLADEFFTMIPAGRWSSTLALPPAPSGQPDPHPQSGKPSVGQPQWARCSDKGRLHLLRPAR